MIAARNRKNLKRLLKLGRWGNESEIIRYGLHLVFQEVHAGQREQLPRPIPNQVMARIYRNETAEEQAIERQLGNASRRYTPQDDQ